MCLLYQPVRHGTRKYAVRGSLAAQALIQVQPALDSSSAVNVFPFCLQIDAATGEEQEVISYNDKVGAVWTLPLQSHFQCCQT